DDELSLLVIIVDTNPIWWGKRAQGEAEFTLSKCLDAAMVMGNSHLFMSRNNRLAVIASHTQESRFLYPGKRWTHADLLGDGTSFVESNCAGSKDGKYELLTAINDAITEEIKDLMTKTEMKGQQTETLLAGSLAKALCCILLMTKFSKLLSLFFLRLFLIRLIMLHIDFTVIKAAEDSALQYMNFMNVIFAAQKQSILIDACVLDSDSGLLQQACDITGGIYLKVLHMPSLLQYLLWVFLPDQEQRAQLVLPPPIHVDYRAACFCHRNLIEIGYVCSVCLSIFCNFSPICSTCETAFKISLPPVMKAKKKKLKLA
ncbi:TF2H3 factor, partial [Crypturellus undulatus]|nr:TF2H3 factor [Crypturellus undulatus]